MSSVTVVITCFNLERYVGAAIESALAQDFHGELDVIVVDDCSTDRSEDVIRSYRRVKYIRTDSNGGSLLAMLKGIEKRSSDLVCLLDGDDVWRPDKLRKTVECFASDRRLAFATHDLGFISDSGKSLRRSSRPEQVLGAARPRERSECIRQGILMHKDYVWLGSAFSFRCSLAQVANFGEWARSLPEAANTYQDWPLAFWIAALPNVELGYVAEKLFDYRLHDLNHSGDASTPEKALRNFRRTRNTVAAMRQIASMRRLPEHVATELDNRLEFLDYLTHLYSGRANGAIKGWWRNARYMRSKRIAAKEMGRLLGIRLLGPSLFSRLASSRSFLRRLPVS